MIITCKQCEKKVEGRPNQKFCSVACKAKSFKTVTKTVTPVTDSLKSVPQAVTDSAPQNNVTTCPKCGYGNYNLNDEWSHSACYKTQAEIEEHYALKNFPRVKYHSVNGGGSGAYAPYPASDPRSVPYQT